MKDAVINGAHVETRSAERGARNGECVGNAVTQNGCADAMTGVEGTLAKILADVLGVDRPSVDSHFFDGLGADSLGMAKFCARIRKRGDLPSVSMKDIYRHPTIRKLAAAFQDLAPASSKPAPTREPEQTPVSAREYVICGALQALFYLAYSYLGVLAAVEGYQLLVGETAGLEKILRLVLFGS